MGTKILSKVILLECCCILTSCKNDDLICEQINVRQHSMQEVSDKEIKWENIFNQQEDSYYVYCYGPTCPHCKKIKNEIIEFSLLNNKTYFCKILNGFNNFSSFSENTIGVGDIEYLTIVGTPTLLEICDGKIFQNICGDESIKSEIKKHFNICN